MSTDWINELNSMDTEALLKALDRIADAAERIAENTERPEMDAPVAPRPPRVVDPPRGMVANFTDQQLQAMRRFIRETARPEFQYGNNDHLMRELFRRLDGQAPLGAALEPGMTPTFWIPERNDYPGRTAAGIAAGFIQRVRNAMRDRVTTDVYEAIADVRHQMVQEQEVAIAQMLRDARAVAGAPAWRVPERLVRTPDPENLTIGELRERYPNVYIPDRPATDEVVFQPTTPTPPNALFGDDVPPGTPYTAEPANMVWRDYAPGDTGLLGGTQERVPARTVTPEEVMEDLPGIERADPTAQALRQAEQTLPELRPDAPTVEPGTLREPDDIPF